MIFLAKGDLLKARTEALVNTVNCVGVMGKGIALQFKKNYSQYYEAYALACRNGEVRPGIMFVQPVGELFTPKYIINFPTKRHWKDQSRIEDIENGLVDLVATIKKLDIESIAIPPLGCGLGGLDWDEVRPRIFHHLEPLQSRVLLFEPLQHSVPMRLT